MTETWIDFDHASTTCVRSEVLDAMIPYFTKDYGNAGSSHRLGMYSNKALNQARRTLAGLLDADDEGLYFTSGATEANNWAIRGAAKVFQEKGKHIITSSIEHPSVLRTCKQLEKEGYDVTYLSVDSSGLISLKQLEDSIRKDTILVSIMFVNNETGVIQPIQEISKICKQHQVLFHTDAVQAFGKIPFSIRELSVDLLTISGHKIYGPKGIGCLYIRKYLKIEPLIFGGHQQNELRAGTEPIPEIVGFAKAAELVVEEREAQYSRLKKLRDVFLKKLQQIYPKLVLNSDLERSVPGILNVSFPGFEAEQILVYLDTRRIYASGGSACTSKDRRPSHVLTAMGKTPVELKGAVRFSFGRENTLQEIETVIDALSDYINK